MASREFRTTDEGFRLMATPAVSVEMPGNDVAVADRALLKMQAYEVLRGWILSERFPAGAFLSERRLAAELGMSKTPVKAALERLAAEGFVVVSPQQGIVVRELTVHEIADQFEIRQALEAFVLRSIAGKLNADETRRLEANLAAAQRAADERNLAASIDLDAEYHQMYCEFLGNREILRVMADLRGRIHRVISRVFGDDLSRLQPCVDEHRRIAQAVIAGDGEEAVAALEDHLTYGKQQLLSPRRR
jgi:DNA-binding GntR family transcriptional regulator